jgi:hypothetical protein
VQYRGDNIVDIQSLRVIGLLTTTINKEANQIQQKSKWLKKFGKKDKQGY